MRLYKGLKETITSSLYRIRSIMIYMQHYRGALNRMMREDPSLKKLLEDICDQSDALSASLDTLMKKIHALPLQAQENPEGDSAKNRRGLKRLKMEGEGVLRFDDQKERLYVLKDISEQGMGIMGKHPLRTRERVDVIISSPFFKSTIYKNVEIVWGKQLDDELWEGGLHLIPPPREKK